MLCYVMLCYVMLCFHSSSNGWEARRSVSCRDYCSKLNKVRRSIDYTNEMFTLLQSLDGDQSHQTLVTITLSILRIIRK